MAHTFISLLILAASVLVTRAQVSTTTTIAAETTNNLPAAETTLLPQTTLPPSASAAPTLSTSINTTLAEVVAGGEKATSITATSSSLTNTSLSTPLASTTTLSSASENGTVGLPGDIDVGAGNASIANNVTVSDEEVNEDEVMAGMLDLQTQLYILSATFGAVIFLLIILVLVLALSVARIKEQLHERLRDERGFPNNGRDAIGYENGGFSSSGNGHVNGVNERSVDGDDLERLGYTQYRGGGNRENVYKVTDPVHGQEGEIPLNEMRNSNAAGGSKPMMKYEEGVVPLGDRDPEMNSNYSYR